MARRLSSRNNAFGFTLVELLIAISILAIVAVLGWRGLDSITRARIQLTAELEQTRGMQLTFAQMESDGEHFVDRLDTRQVSRSSIQRPRLATDQGRLTMIRTVFVENQPSRFQVVAYRVKDGILSRRESHATRDPEELDAIWKATLDDADSAPAVALLSGVTGMSFRLWEENQNRQKGPWRVVAGVVPADSYDTGMEVEIKLGEKETGIVKKLLLGGF